MPRGTSSRSESPTVQRLRASGRWNEAKKQYKRPQHLYLMQMPEEILFTIASHCTYPMLLKWMQTCKLMKTHGLDTWRGQARLLTSKAFGTEENYAVVFDRYVTKRLWADDADWLDAGVHIVYSYMICIGDRGCPMETNITNHHPHHELRPAEMLERYRFIMKHAEAVFGAEWERYERNKRFIHCNNPDENDPYFHNRLLKRLSGIHSSFQAYFLLAHTGYNFKNALDRMMEGYCIPWSEQYKHRYSQGWGHFVDGNVKETDQLPETAPEPVEPPGPDPAPIQQQMAALFGHA